MSISENEFWEIVETSRDMGDRREEHLECILEKMPLVHLYWFHYWLGCAHENLYRESLRKYAIEVFGECGDDSFCGFRLWLTSQGREVYECAVSDPQRLREYFPGGEEEPNGHSSLGGFVEHGFGTWNQRAGDEEVPPEQQLPPAIPNSKGRYIDTIEGA